MTRYQGQAVRSSGTRGVLLDAWDRQLERSVWVRIPPPHFASDPEFCGRFMREARTLASLDHSVLLQVYDVPEVPGGETPLMVLEASQGKSLAIRVETRTPASTAEIKTWAQQLGSVLDYVHRLGIVHRNLQPESLMLTDSGDLQLTDFGMAAVRDASQLTGIGINLGAPAYQPPGQLAGGPADAAGDLYALAALLYELASGASPFERGDMTRQRPRPFPSETQFPAAAIEVLERALDPDKTRRFDSGQAFADALSGSL